MMEERAAPRLGIVLVPLDGSPSTEAAVDLGAAVAERAGAALHLAAIVGPEEAKLDLGNGVDVTQPGSREYAPVLDEHVARLAADARERFACEVEATVIDAPDPERGIAEYERHARVGMTVMGVPVPRPDDGDLLSSVAIRAASGPLLFLSVPEAGDGERKPVPPTGRVGVVAGTYDAADAVLRCAADYARLWEAELRVIVGADGDAPPEERLQELLTELSREGAGVEALRFGAGDSAQALLHRLERERVDTVVTGYARKTLAERLLFGADEVERRPRLLVCPE